MKVLRWIICFPVAGILSWLAWPLIGQVFNHAYYGGGIIRSAIGLAPLIITTSIPAIVLVLAGVWISPSKGRKVVFVFFALGLIYSGGGFAMITFQEVGALEFWLTSAAGVVLGSLAGLLLGLRLQTFRKGRPNKSPLRTPVSVAPAADAPVPPPPGAAGL